MQKRLHLKIYGRVQGVIFRDFTRRKAKKLGIVGTVQNLNNGTVEVFAQAGQKTLDEFLKHLKIGSLFSRVEKVDATFKKTINTYTDFTILY